MREKNKNFMYKFYWKLSTFDELKKAWANMVYNIKMNVI